MAPTAAPTATSSFDPAACAAIRCREPPFEPGSLCEFCLGGSAAPTREPTTPPPTDAAPPVPTTVVVPWIIPVANQAITVEPSAKITFEWPSVHNVYEMPSAAAYTSCDFSAATEVCPVAADGSCTIDAPAAGETKYYACRETCRLGQVVAITGAAVPGIESTDDDRQGCFPFCGDKSDAPPPTPKPTTTLAKGGKADKDEDESDGSAALSHSLAAAVVALLAA